MGKSVQIRPVRIYQTVTQELVSSVTPRYPRDKPAWYDVVFKIPPSESQIRTVPVRHRHLMPKMKRPARTFIPQTIRFLEDHLRDVFYKQHPWELVRPRIITENDGRDYENHDWSKGLEQPGLPLCGESVVQRWLWLMKVARMPRSAAYDKARKEFYALRQQEQMNRRIAQEEAAYVGAYFGKTRLEVSMQLEDETFKKWHKWAGKQVAAAEASRNPDGPISVSISGTATTEGEAAAAADKAEEEAKRDPERGPGDQPRRKAVGFLSGTF